MNTIDLRLRDNGIVYETSTHESFLCSYYVQVALQRSNNSLPLKLRVRWVVGKKKEGYSRIRHHDAACPCALVNGEEYRLFSHCLSKLPVGRTVYFKIEEA